MNNSRSQYPIAGDGNAPRFSDAGSGNAVLVLHSASRALKDRLAENFRVITLETGDSREPQSIAQSLRRTAEQLAIAKYSLIAGSEFAEAAMAHTIDSADSVESLILIAPKDASNGASIDLHLEQCKAPTLVLFGTRDQVVASEAGRAYARRIPKSFYTLVYDAGHDIGADRPQALHAVVRDFLEHGEKFVIAYESSVINP
jgi:pimeloyl-ACP methyl ester carboxylesterase